MIAGVTAPVLQSKEPVTPVAVKMDFPQLSATPTPGAGGVCLGTATPVPARLRQPFELVTVTLYVPAVPTEMEVEEAPVFHNNEPVKLLAVSVEVLPQLLTTVTVGAEGIALKDDVPLPVVVHPSAAV